jgi:hypothetical protein
MSSRVQQKKQHGALKHGGYSALGVLPGESPTEFERLRKGLIEDLAPRGPLEDDIVSTLARLLWRKNNRSTFRAAAFAKTRLNAIIDEISHRDRTLDVPPGFWEREEVQAARKEEKMRTIKEQAQKELGDLYELSGIDVATDKGLLAELEVEERLDALIDKCLKRLLMVRGVKSMVIQAPSESLRLTKPPSINSSAA